MPLSEKKQERPRLIDILAIVLLLQAPVLVFFGLNLLTNHWTFLYSWTVFWQDISDAFAGVMNTPGEIQRSEVVLYDAVGFGVLAFSAGTALFAGLRFKHGSVFVWVMSLVTQIGTLVTGIGLYVIHRPSQAYWIMAVGILMVLYLNYEEVRQWFLQTEAPVKREGHGED